MLPGYEHALLELPGCPWVFCKKCMALTGIFAGKMFYRGGVERIR